MSEALLLIEDLVKHFRAHRTGLLGRRGGDVQAVDGVSFSISTAETLGIVGESGCGKSTLARLLVRLVEPTSGHAWYRGRDLFSLSRTEMRAVRSDIQMIFQDPYSSVNPRMTVEKIVAEAWDMEPDRAPKARRRKRVTELLERVGLDADALDRYTREFSGGQLQRVGIARALAVDPKLLICDEPVSALDVSIQAQILNLLTELRRESGLACIFITHDLAVVEHVTDRIAVMYFGKFIETGPAQKLCGNPSHPYTQALLSAVPVAVQRGETPSRRIRLEGELPDPTAPPSGCRFRTRCWKAQALCAEDEPALVARVQPDVAAACHFAETLAASEVSAPASSSSFRQSLA